jgi:hypothetical protein
MLSGEPIRCSQVLYKQQMLICSRRPGKVLSEARGACGVIVRLRVNVQGKTGRQAGDGDVSQGGR